MYPDFNFWLQHSHGLLIGNKVHTLWGKQIKQTHHVSISIRGFRVSLTLLGNKMNKETTA